MNDQLPIDNVDNRSQRNMSREHILSTRVGSSPRPGSLRENTRGRGGSPLARRTALVPPSIVFASSLGESSCKQGHRESTDKVELRV